MPATLVFGHLNPDTDTTCSAIAYAWLLKQQGTEAEPRVLGNLNKETTYILKRFEVETPALLPDIPAGTPVVVVDTNNPEELPESIGGAELTEIIDHHKLVGGLSTKDPIAVTMRPVACTATIIWEKMQLVGVQPERSIAGLMLGAILSDTLNFTSPTTTAVDKQVAEELAVLAGVEMEEMASAQSDAKSDLSGLSNREILTQDSKIFALGNAKVRISVLETTKPDNAFAMQDQLLAEARLMRDEEGLRGIFFFIVDVTKSHATLVLAGDWEKQVAEKAFQAESQDGMLQLPGVLSRKKQMVPAIEGGIKALGF